MKLRSVLALSLAALAALPVQAQEAPAARDSFARTELKFQVETVVEGVQVPWAIAWTSPDRMLFTERPGRVRAVVGGVLSPEPVFTVPDVLVRSETGLMGLAIHPDYAKNKYVYLSFGFSRADAEGKKVSDIRVQRFIDDGSSLKPDAVILNWTPAGPNHAGCRIAFGPDRKLYITTGEGFKGELAQDLTTLAGKILRVNDDGTPCADNPFAGEANKAKGARPEIYSYGHRNPQGIDWQPGTNVIYSTEHGPSGENSTGGDEFNRVEAGKNYGWPVIHHDQTKQGMESPLVVWDPAMAPASGVFYNAELFPELKGNFLTGMLGGLGAKRRPGVVRLVLEDGKVTRQELLLTDLGRVRCVAVGPDGAIYVSTSNRDGRARPGEKDDRIIRLVPAK